MWYLIVLIPDLCNLITLICLLIPEKVLDPIAVLWLIGGQWSAMALSHLFISLNIPSKFYDFQQLLKNLFFFFNFRFPPYKYIQEQALQIKVNLESLDEHTLLSPYPQC